MSEHRKLETISRIFDIPQDQSKSPWAQPLLVVQDVTIELGDYKELQLDTLWKLRIQPLEINKWEVPDEPQLKNTRVGVKTMLDLGGAVLRKGPKTIATGVNEFVLFAPDYLVEVDEALAFKVSAEDDYFWFVGLQVKHINEPARRVEFRAYLCKVQKDFVLTATILKIDGTNP